MSPKPLFVPYTELKQPLPPAAWRVLRWVGVAAALATVVACFVRPAMGLTIFWGILVPVLPAVFLIMPGLWRNLCPMASLNQVPRTLNFTRGWTVPVVVQQYTPLISAGLFLLIVPMRRALLDGNGPALGVFLATVLALAFAGGAMFKGKSGWCSQFCPVLQVERFYGQSPLIVLPNSHCRPCVGCNRNCYDFNPTAAYLADLHDPNPRLALNRKLFAGVMPWLIVGFFTQPDLVHPDLASIVLLYGRLALLATAGMGFLVLIQHLTGLSDQKVVLLHATAAFIVFYAFVGTVISAPLGFPAMVVGTVTALVALIVAAVWLRRAWPRDAAFVAASQPEPARAAEGLLRAHEAEGAGKLEVSFIPGPTMVAAAGTTLLDLAEAHQVPIQSGCRMGMCGADPVRILEGSANLSVATSQEKATLDRLGLAAACRLACSARVQGPVKVTSDLEAVPKPAAAASEATKVLPALQLPADVKRVVVIGSGPAGISAALELRKLQPMVEVTLYGGEPYTHYNRMAINKLVSESTSIDKLYLLPPDWAARKGLRFEPGVRVTSIRPDSHTVQTGSGEDQPYDRLILAPGAESFVPPLPGNDLTGAFVLRTIDDAISIQQHIRRHRVRSAVVVGGGPLGLEAAHSLVDLGLRVTVLDRGPWPLNRQLDEAAGMLVRRLLDHLGIQVVSGSPRAIVGPDKVRGVELEDGTVLEATLCLLAAGIKPNLELATEVGLATGRGIKVDHLMRTSRPEVFAAGDAVEVEGHGFGLWPAAIEQGRIAAINALGGHSRFVPVMPPMRLKIAALDVLSAGVVNATADDEVEVCLEAPAENSYRKLVLRNGKVVGATLVGHPELFDAVMAAVDSELDASAIRTELEAGDWTNLEAGSPADPVLN